MNCSQFAEIEIKLCFSKTNYQEEPTIKNDPCLCGYFDKNFTDGDCKIFNMKYLNVK